MTKHYSDPKRAGEPNALPDVEVFYVGTICLGSALRRRNVLGTYRT